MTPFIHFALSCVDLPGKAIEKNLERIQRSLKIGKSILPNITFQIIHYHLPNQNQIDTTTLSNLGRVTELILSVDRPKQWNNCLKRIININ